MILTEPRIQIRNKCLILYDLIDSTGHWKPSTLLSKQKHLSQTQVEAYSGKLTAGAKKRLSKAIDLMCQSVKIQMIYSPVAQKTIRHRLSFITLTVSQKDNITAREAYDKAFKHFLQWLRRTAKVTTYVWKCEVQNRGQIHYHITTPSYIHYQEIRDKWNNLQRQNGWTDEYFKTKGHHNPNSTDIHEVRQVRDLSSYMIKEFCKSIQNTEGNKVIIDELQKALPEMIANNDTVTYLQQLKRTSSLYKVWDCSINLKKWKYYSIYESREKTDLMNELIMSEKVEAIPCEHCIVIRLKKASNTEVMHLKELQQYEEFLTMIRNYRKET